MITFMESKEKIKEMEMCLDSQLWHACAGGMVQMPSVNSRVFYFPQGHAEHACGPVDLRNCPRIPPYILCRVAAVKFMADPDTDEGTPRRHLLTTGWSNFVNHKKLVAGDSIVFLRAENGDLCVGIRRAKRGIGGPESSSVWNAAASNCLVPYGGFSAFMREDENKLMRNGSSNGLSLNSNLMGKTKIRPEQVIEAATMAAKGQQFEVVYYPRSSTPEFCVKASLVKAALQIRWCSGMRFKMAFETEDSSRISWFMGSISSVQVVDPLLWPGLTLEASSVHLSPFSPPRKKLRLLQHPDFPPDGELPLPTFSGNLLGPSNPFRCLPNTSPAGMQGARHAHYGLSISDLHLNKLQSGLFPSCFPPFDHTATSNRISNGGLVVQNPNMSENVSCVLSIGRSTENSTKTDNAKTPQLVLFGQPILTEQQISRSCSGDAVSLVLEGNSSSEKNQSKTANFSDGSGSTLHQQHLPVRASCEGFPWYKDNRHEAEPNLETGHCKVLME
ncbi:dihydrofolate reductase-like isoform X1 [Hibiscus syriacus]|uniref:Auxin response factor n=1 Tax=Hibiscus syriacus TaxID=106335 RepID=A0A6A2WLU6_HIBSY|nr:dihydrofolate reductase-like isoform X1 [Hibiscus syriacus]